MPIIDNLRFFDVTKTSTENGKRVRRLMAIHKLTGETFFFTTEEIEAMKKPCEFLCEIASPYGFVPEAGCPIHD